jgi:hypothetical protein
MTVEMRLIDFYVDALGDILEDGLSAKITAINTRKSLTGVNEVQAPERFYRQEMPDVDLVPAVELIMEGDSEADDDEPGDVLFSFSVRITVGGATPERVAVQIQVYQLAINELIAENRTLTDQCVFAKVAGLTISGLSQGNTLTQEASIPIVVSGYESERNDGRFRMDVD